MIEYEWSEGEEEKCTHMDMEERRPGKKRSSAHPRAKGQANPVTGPAARSDAAGRMGDGWLAGSAYSFPVKWTGGTEY